MKFTHTFLLLFLPCFFASNFSPYDQYSREIFGNFSEVSNDLTSIGYNMKLYDFIMDKASLMLPRMMKNIAVEEKEDLPYKYVVKFNEHVRLATRTKTTDSEEAIKSYLKTDEVKNKWNTAMTSADEIFVALETALENTYNAMQPEIDEFVFEVDADLEQNVRVLYKVLSKYFISFIEPKMIHDFFGEIQKLENVSKGIKAFFELLDTHERALGNDEYPPIGMIMGMVLYSGFDEEWVLSEKENTQINRSIQVFKGNLTNLTRVQMKSKNFREKMFYYERKCRKDILLACNRVLKSFKKRPSDNLFDFTIRSLAQLAEWSEAARKKGKVSYKVQLTLKELENFNKLSEEEFVEMIRHNVAAEFPDNKNKILNFHIIQLIE